MHLPSRRVGGIFRVRSPRAYPIPSMSVQDHLLETRTEHNTNICSVRDEVLPSASSFNTGLAVLVDISGQFDVACSRGTQVASPMFLSVSSQFRAACSRSVDTSSCREHYSAREMDDHHIVSCYVAN